MGGFGFNLGARRDAPEYSVSRQIKPLFYRLDLFSQTRNLLLLAVPRVGDNFQEAGLERYP